MDKSLSNVSDHMLALGRAALAHAINMLVFCDSIARYNRFEERDSIAVLTAAHAAEILIKSRIAKEHPLLIFQNIPKRSRTPENSLTLNQLMENGRTLMFSELPDRLWASTGYELPALEIYQSFSQLRNIIQHFARPDRNLVEETIEFIFSVVQPFLWEHWKLLAIEHFDDPDGDRYVIEFVAQFSVEIQVRESWRSWIEDLGLNQLQQFIFVADEDCSDLSKFHKW